jgi:uncharacterized protein YyaL (SSP411 family)
MPIRAPAKRAAPKVAALLVLACLTASVVRADSPDIAWQDWSDDLFAKAARDHRFVLLDLEAVWCHWCHVMDQKTYRDPKVRAIVAASFIAVKVDQDSRPDLAERYKDYGWPATIMFAPDGSERVKLAGYYGAQLFQGILQGALETPPKKDVPIPAATAAASRIPDAKRAAFQHDFDASYDLVNSGWGRGYKFIDGPSMDYSLDLAFAGDAEAARRAKATLDHALLLIDPVWGGAYQYSDEVDWHSPHFEKIMTIQSVYLRAYARAWSRWKDPRYRQAADDIYRFLRDRLRAPDGSFYVSQDSDLSAAMDGHKFYALDAAARQNVGAPPIDRHRYASETGLAVGALAAYYDATGTSEALDLARAGADWALRERALPGGGFRHGDADIYGPYLGDSLAMADAMLALYRSSGERSWLAEARRTADFILATFVEAQTGALLAAVPRPSDKPIRPIDANIGAARLLNLLSAVSGDAKYRAASERILGYLVLGQVAERLELLPGALLLDRELAREPVHVTVVGPRADALAERLMAAALAYPTGYKRVDRWDRAEGPLPNSDVDYPDAPAVAAYACSQNQCSLPVTAPEKLAAALDRVGHRPAN